MATNRFCPTGKGGGIDPTCTKDESGWGGRNTEKVSEVEFDLGSTGRSDWDETLKEEGPRFKTKVVHMTPDEYLVRVNHKRHLIDQDKVERYAKQLRGSVIPTPTMWFVSKYAYDSGLGSSWHDGTHRALALKRLGVTEMPVLAIWEE